VVLHHPVTNRGAFGEMQSRKKMHAALSLLPKVGILMKTISKFKVWEFKKVKSQIL